MGLNTKSFYEFGPFRLEPDEHLLLRGDKSFPLSPKAFELLIFLVQNPGRLLTREQTMRAVWPDSSGEEANLTVWISVLRSQAFKHRENLRSVAPSRSRQPSGASSIVSLKKLTFLGHGRLWTWRCGPLLLHARFSEDVSQIQELIVLPLRFVGNQINPLRLREVFEESSL